MFEWIVTMKPAYDAVAGILLASWNILLDSAPYILVGFSLAGLIKAWISTSFVSRSLGRNGVLSVIKASLVGIPLPLCSCSVIPVAAGLQKQGASRGATAAFLISTPESGVDSIAITYALMDPVMTVIRPLAAFVTATINGLLIDLIPAGKPNPEPEPAAGGG